MPTQITDTAISAAKKRAADAGVRVELADAVLPGLRLRLTQKGAASWVLGCRDRDGRARRFGLGEYPTLGIREAREAARAMRAEIRKGADPIADARRQRVSAQVAREGVGTLAALLDLYGRKRGATLKSWPECRRRINSVFGRHLNKPVTGLSIADLQMAADTWESSQSAAAAVRYLRPVLKWAAQAGRAYVSRDLTELTPPATVKRRDRVLRRDELAKLLPAIRASNRPYAAALRFMMLTLCRREEASAARWQDVDLTASTWTIPSTKNGQPHVVPLSRQAIEVLCGRRPATVEPSALIFCTETGGRLGNWDRETKRIMAASQTAKWTRHDLRRTGATMLGEMGELPDIVEAGLNHASIRSTLAATYNRSRYRPQVAAALQRLGDALDGIENGAGAIIAMRPR